MTRGRLLWLCLGHAAVGVAISAGAIFGLFFLGKAVGWATGP